MDQCTHEVRAEYWKKIIQACGQSAKSWMDENGICEQSYYHWQRRFRKQAYEEMKENASVPAVAEKTELTFVEMDWQRSSAISMGKIPSKRERSFCFAESVPIGARDSCGWVPDFYFCTNVLRQDDYPGQGIHRKQRILPKNSTSIL